MSQIEQELLPPPTVPRKSALRAWVDMLDTGDALIRAGLRARFGVDQEEARYRELRRRELEDHDRRLERMLTELTKRELPGGG